MLRTRSQMAAMEPEERAIDMAFDRRGSIATQTALVLPAMLAFTALAVDAAWLYNEEVHQQAVMDAAALAGVSGMNVDENTVYNRAIAIAAANKSTNNSAYTISAIDVEIGYWEDGAFVEAEFDDANSEDFPAVRVTYPGHPVGLFFAQLFTGTATSNVATRATASRMVLGDGPPANCGVLADSTLTVAGSQITDGYSSDDCGGGGYDASKRDLEVGVCSNGGVTLQGAAGNHMYGGVSWGPEDNVSTKGNPNVHGAMSQLADEVDVPAPSKCTAAQITTSNAFWAAISTGAGYSKCFADVDKDGTADGSYKDVLVDFTCKTCTVGGPPDVKFAGATLNIDESCGAPSDLCVNNLDLQNGGLYTKGSSYKDGSYTNTWKDGSKSDGSHQAASSVDGVVKVMANGNIEMNAQTQFANTDDSTWDTATNRYISNGNAVGSLEVHAAGEMKVNGGSDLSGVLYAGGNIGFNGTASYFGAIFSQSSVTMSGNFLAHIDRCYEVSTSRGNGDTDVISLPQTVLVQ